VERVIGRNPAGFGLIPEKSQQVLDIGKEDLSGNSCSGEEALATSFQYPEIWSQDRVKSN